MALNDTKIRSIQKTDRILKLSDGGGLYLHVNTNGSKLWRMAYRFAGKQKTLSFGAYPDVSLLEARQKRDAAKTQIAKGLDPSDLVRQEKLQAKVNSQNTFSAVAEEFLLKISKEGKAEATLSKKRWLLNMAISSFGHRPIIELTAVEILVPLRSIESKGKFETAKRLRATIGQVFRYAIATGRAENDPTFGLRGALINPVVTHRAAILDAPTYSKLIMDIWDYDGKFETRTALKLMALLYPRPGELRQAEWSEFDLEKQYG
ncbi:MAG: tyrosine-type recombinase/integrase [Nitratireductor sp.]